MGWQVCSVGYLESAVGFCDLGWSRVCQPPARETDAVGVLLPVAAYRGVAGAAGVIEVGYGFEECAGRTIPKE